MLPNFVVLIIVQTLDLLTSTPFHTRWFYCFWTLPRELCFFPLFKYQHLPIIRFTLDSAKVPPKGKVNWYYDYSVNFFIGIFTNASAIPIKCFLCHRRTEPFFFSEIVKKKFQIRSSKKRVLYFTSTRPCFINNWNDVMSLSLINVYTTAFI